MVWAKLGLHLLHQGWDVSFACYSFDQNPLLLGELIRRGAKPFYLDQIRFSRVQRCKRMAMRRIGRDPVRQRFGADHWLLRLVDEVGPDLVYINLSFIHELANFHDAIPRLRHAGIPVVALSALDTETGTMHDRYRHEMRFALHALDRIAFLSRPGQALVERFLAVRLSNAMIVPGTFGSTGNEVPWPKDNGVMKMACMSRLWTPQKGQHRFVSILNESPFRDRSWSYTLYGRGEDKNYLTELVDLYQLGEKIKFGDPSSTVEVVWAREELLVMMSRIEGLPLALVEAALAGRPAIVTDVGGNAEFVQHGVTGWVADGSSDKAFAFALRQAFDAYAEWPAMGQLARKRALELLAPGLEQTLEASMLEVLAHYVGE